MFDTKLQRPLIRLQGHVLGAHLPLIPLPHLNGEAALDSRPVHAVLEHLVRLQDDLRHLVVHLALRIVQGKAENFMQSLGR
jgi:hypothetical protein